MGAGWGLGLTATEVGGSHVPGSVWPAVVVVCGGRMVGRLEMGMWTRVWREVGERVWLLVPEYRQKGKLDVVWCGPHEVLEELNKGENVKLDIPALFDGLRVIFRHSIKPYIHQEGQPLWKFPMPPVKTGDSPPLVKILATHRVGSKKRGAFLYRCEWDDDTWSWESSKALEEEATHLAFLRLHPEYRATAGV